jgi:hypothetical protein
MIDLAAHILDTKASKFNPHKFKDKYETALKALVKRKAAIAQRNAACRDAIRCRRRHHITCKGSGESGYRRREGLDLSNDARQPRRDRIGLL